MKTIRKITVMLILFLIVFTMASCNGSVQNAEDQTQTTVVEQKSSEAMTEKASEVKSTTVTATEVTAKASIEATTEAAAKEERNVPKFALDKKEVLMISGGAVAVLNLENNLENSDKGNVIWTSSDKTVALVQDGVVTSVGVGSVEITVKCGEYSDKAVINVKATECLITNDTFYVDVDGNPIYSQGEGIFQFGDTYYWYGVKYEEAVKYEKNPVVLTASKSNQTTFSTVTCYSSKDLVNWKFEDDVVTTETPDCGLLGWFGRLGVMYNEKNNNYVMVSQVYSIQNFEPFEAVDGMIFLTCDTPTGDFKFADFQDRNEGAMSQVKNGRTGDQTVFIDDDGKAYLICSNAEGRSNIYICEFNEDYTQVDKVTRVYRGRGLEGNCMFKYNNRYYICSSLLHGWNSSPAYVLMSDTDDILGTYKLLKEPMKNSAQGYCHVSQTGFFYTVKGTKQDTVLFCGDRWSGFAGNGMGFNVWMPLSFEEDGTPIFNDISQFILNEETGEWKVGPNNNYVINPVFEADRIKVSRPVGWNVSDSVGGKANSNLENISMYCGRWAWQQKSNEDYTATIKQKIENLPDGKYTLKAWVKSSGGQNTAKVYIKDYGKEEVNVSVAEEIAEWKQVTVCEELEIKNGSCEIGLFSDAKAGQWVIIDDITLIRSQK